MSCEFETNDSWFSQKAEGELETKFYGIPVLLYISKSTIFNKKEFRKHYLLNKKFRESGKVYALHITPFIAIGLVIPSFLIKKSDATKFFTEE